MFSSSQLHALFGFSRFPTFTFLITKISSTIFFPCTVTPEHVISGLQCAKRGVSVAPLAWMLQDKAGVQAAASDLGAAACDLNEAQTLYLSLLEKLGAGLGFFSKGLLVSSFFTYLITPKNKLLFTRKQNHSPLAICCCLAGERFWSWKSVPERSTSFSSSNYSIDRLTCNCLLPLWQIKSHLQRLMICSII